MKDREFIFLPDDSYNIKDSLNSITCDIPKSFNLFLSHKNGNFKEKFLALFLSDEIYLPIEKESPFFVKDKDLEAKLDKFSDEMKKQLLLNKDGLNFYKVSIIKFIEGYFSSVLRQEMSSLNNTSKVMKKLYNDLDPVFSYSQHSLGKSNLMGEWCKRNNSKGLLASHGSHINHNDKIANKEWLYHADNLIKSHYPFTAVQSVFTQNFLKKNIELDSINLYTGPLILSKKSSLRRDVTFYKNKIFNEKKEKIIISHIGTPKPSSTMRPWVYETIDEYIFNINSLIDATSSLNNIFLVIRFRPNKWLTYKDFNCLINNKSSNVVIHQSSTLAENLAASDFIVSYSSTAVEEAVESEVPVLLFDPQNKYNHLRDALDHKLLDRYLYVDSQEYLEEIISNIDEYKKKFAFLGKPLEELDSNYKFNSRWLEDLGIN